jgi:hypothetical protein
LYAIFTLIPNFRRTSLRSILHQYGSTKNPEEIAAWENYNIDKDLLLNNNKQEKIASNAFPKRQRIAGRDFGLSLIIQMDKKPQACPILSSKGGLVRYYKKK